MPRENGPGERFDPQLGRQWGKFVGFLGANRPESMTIPLPAKWEPYTNKNTAFCCYKIVFSVT